MDRPRERALDERIGLSWVQHDDGDIDESRLLQMVMDDTGADMDRVIAGLARVGILENP